MLLTLHAIQHSSTIAYDRTTLRIMTSDEAGYQRVVPADATKLARVDAAIKLASQWWYKLEPLGEPYVHEWSFLHPIFQFNTVVGQYQYDLPFDYAGHEGWMSFGPSRGFARIPFVAPHHIDDARMFEGEGTGTPRMASVIIVQRDIPQSQLYVLELHPPPSEVVPLRFTMNLSPPEVSDAYPFIYGSALHSDAILSCCFAAWEYLYQKGQNVRYEHMLRRLRAAVEQDRKTIRQEYLGYNADRSDQRRRVRTRYEDEIQQSWPSTFTYNGVPK